MVENVILYKLEFDFLQLIENFMPTILISVGFLYFGIKYWIKQNVNLRILSILFLIISTTFFAISIFNLTDDIILYKKYTKIISDETFESVTGCVSNFHSADLYGKGEESFSINGVEFSYVQYENFIGYHNVSTKGGVINGNNQVLTVKYVYDEYQNKNVILQIETPMEHNGITQTRDIEYR